MLLIPNIGAEEERPWDSPVGSVPGAGSHLDRELARAVTARLWQALFADGSRYLVDSESVSNTEWPPGLGVRSVDAVFPWLEASEGVTAWLNTPAAELRARAEERSLSGAAPEVVRAVHDKAFAYRVAREAGMFPARLGELISVLDPELLRDSNAAIREVEERVGGWPKWTTFRFTLKPRLGTSGRGRVAGVAGSAAQCRGSFERLAGAGGALLEPWLKRTCDLATQLWIGAEDQLVLLGTAELVVDSSGLYRGHRGFVDSRGRVTSGRPVDEVLRESAVVVARAAAREGYRGPCGVDAFTFEIEPGHEELRPVVEFNARFTLGIIAIGLLRRALPRIRRELLLDPGELHAFEFRLGAPPGGWPEQIEASEILWIPLSGSGHGPTPGLLVARDREMLDRVLPEVAGY